MAVRRKKTDEYVKRIVDTLRTGYVPNHPKAKIEAYRYNPASIRIRIIDPDFSGKDLVERDEMVWPIVESLPEDIRSEITLLLLIAPRERDSSLSSMEFDDPTPSRL